MRANFDGDHDGDLFGVEICPHRPDIYDFRPGAETTKSTTQRGAVAHAPRPIEGGLLEKKIAKT